jgi:hypothetical protein
MAGKIASVAQDTAPNPYIALPEQSFWKPAVADKSAFEIRGLWSPKFRVLPKHKIVTAGSCFAQHIGNALSARGYNWFDAEPAPEFLSNENRRKFNYGVFSFRTGNIYTAAALRQWVEWAFDLKAVPDEVWEKNGRFYDPFRPAIEPGGFASAKEVLASRIVTLAAIRKACEQAKFFVFTMGLTESWCHSEKGYEYAMCPGTIAGTFDPEKHKFRNHVFNGIKDDIKAVVRIIHEKNKGMRFLLTISPVPLTATASGQHVLTATVQSKSTLRTVAGELAAGFSRVDYFPSYEIITSAPYRAMFFEPNLRSVTPSGVALVMDNFFHDQAQTFGKPPVLQKLRNKKPATKTVEQKPIKDVVCEEEMLNAFAN